MAVRILCLLLTLSHLPVQGAAQRAQGPVPMAQTALEAGRGAVKRGNPERARGHFERALTSEDVRRDAARELGVLGKDAGDGNLLGTAALIHAEASVEAGGKLRSDGAVGRRGWKLGKDSADFGDLAARAARARVKLAAALLELAKEREAKGGREPAGLLTAAWARRFALDLLRRTPLARGVMGRALDPEVSLPKGAFGPVLKGLERAGSKGFSSGDYGLPCGRDASCAGSGSKRTSRDLRGDRPGGMAKWRAKGSELLAKARERQVTKLEKPWTVDELEWLATEEGEAFTRSHRSFAEPGSRCHPTGCIAWSPTAAMRLFLGWRARLRTTTDGWWDYFAEDPFVDRDGKIRQGLIRVVPDPSGLEAEGAPFFWVGGFQGGDTTVVQLSAGTIAGLGRTLTHELTHRFDGALHRGIPAWLAEGRAVWTGSAYHKIADATFDPTFASHGGLLLVANQGLAGGTTLRKILSGTPGDYRQNYTAGLGLYRVSRQLVPGRCAQAQGGHSDFPQCPHGVRRPGKHPRDPDELLKEFEDTFCDGQDGRPASLEEFEEGLSVFPKGLQPEAAGAVCGSLQDPLRRRRVEPLGLRRAHLDPGTGGALSRPLGRTKRGSRGSCSRSMAARKTRCGPSFGRGPWTALTCARLGGSTGCSPSCARRFTGRPAGLRPTKPSGSHPSPRRAAQLQGVGVLGPSLAASRPWKRRCRSLRRWRLPLGKRGRLWPRIASWGTPAASRPGPGSRRRRGRRSSLLAERRWRAGSWSPRSFWAGRRGSSRA